jgi:hypothetical protein
MTNQDRALMRTLIHVTVDIRRGSLKLHPLTRFIVFPMLKDLHLTLVEDAAVWSDSGD